MKSKTGPATEEPAQRAEELAALHLALDSYYAEHERICLDPEARNARHTYVKPSDDRRSWLVQQVLVDPEGHNDWIAEFAVDLSASRASGEPQMRLAGLRALNQMDRGATSASSP